MRSLLYCILLSLVMLIPAAALHAQAPQPVYVPPEAQHAGLTAHLEDLAVLETSGRTPQELIALRDALTEQGALVSIIASPGRMLAWVPPEAEQAVRETRLSFANGSEAAVLSLSRTAAEFEQQHAGAQLHSAESEAARALVAYLEFVRNPMSEEERRSILEQMEATVTEPFPDPSKQCDIIEPLPPEALPLIDPVETENRTLHSSGLHGYIVHTAFFMDSEQGSGFWDWDPLRYNRYRNFYIAGINYWTSFAARYGKTITTHLRVFSPNAPETQLPYEPSFQTDSAFVKDIVGPLVNWPHGAGFLADRGHRFICLRYNYEIRTAFDADEAFCGFIAFRDTGKAGIWPHARGYAHAGGREGLYFAMDTRYPRTKEYPFSRPMENVIAHEIGHLLGAPDEYKSSNCNFSRRGMPNINCRSQQPAYGRSGTMQGYGGIMVANYTGGSSLATPVHIGVRDLEDAAPVRMFDSNLDTLELDLKNCNGRGDQERITPFGIPMGFDYCFSVTAPRWLIRGSTQWYFSYWEVTQNSGQVTEISSTTNTLLSASLPTDVDDPVRDIRAIFTDSPPDFYGTNRTVEANLATAGTGSASPPPALALRWQNRYDMSVGETRIEVKYGSHDWMEMGREHYIFDPKEVDIGQWTGVLITHVPDGSGNDIPVESDTKYLLRFRGLFNNTIGEWSDTESVTTPPTNDRYCTDNNEPNSEQNPKNLPVSEAGMEVRSVEGAIPLVPLEGEFTFFKPVWDYYRIPVLDVSSSTFGEHLVLRLKVREGSDFKPRFSATLLGGSHPEQRAYFNEDSAEYILPLRENGFYLIKVESEISGGAVGDIVNPTEGYYSFGEYTIELQRERISVDPYLPDLCLGCVKYTFTQPMPGQLVMKPHPISTLFEEGIDPDDPIMFNMYYHVPPGYSFQGFGGDLGMKHNNPAQMEINPETEAGEYNIYPIIEPIAEGSTELVVIHPEGPAGAMELRQSTAAGEQLTATASVPEGFAFAGWGGDTTASENSLTLTMWESKRLIAHYRKKPCEADPMTAWMHELSFRNAEQSRVTMEYGMQQGAGDGLEAGQTDLPPVPPPTAFDIRWLNIPGSQGSHTDLRAITSSHTFQGQVQTGSAEPVTMEWTSPPVIPNARYTLSIQGVADSIDMRMQNLFTFQAQGRYIFTIEVRESDCAEPAEENDIVVVTEDVDTDNWPCVDLRLKLYDRATGDPRPFADPFQLSIMERTESGATSPVLVDAVIQRDSLLIYRICPEADDPLRDREIIVVNDPENEDQREDTTTVHLDPPVPDGSGDPETFVLRSNEDWRMVSVPLVLEKPSVRSLFAVGDYSMYRFDADEGRYISVEDLRRGRGYWLKGDEMEKTIVGLAQSALEWNDLSGIGEPYGYGWNMIGTLHRPIAVSSIEQQPAGGLHSIFGWDPAQGYVIPTLLEPGKGYWVRVEPNASLRISTSGVALGRRLSTRYARVARAIDPAGALHIADEQGGSRMLYLSLDEAPDAETLDALALPGLPPTGVTDVRTGTGTQYVFAGETTLHVRSSGPVQLSVSNAAAHPGIELYDSADRLIHVFDEETPSMTLGGSGHRVLTLRSAVRTSHTAQQLSAASFALGENYPNPFDQSTTISFTLDRPMTVSITITDALGRTVARPLRSAAYTVGRHTVTFDARAGLPAGMYSCRLETEDGILLRNMLLSR